MALEVTIPQPGTFSAELCGYSSGASNHTQLTGRDSANQHPISSITGLQTALDEKQSAISDLDTIRSGAALGATALQEHQSLAQYQAQAIADTGDYYTDDTVEGALQEIGAELSGINTLLGSGVIA